MPGTGSPAGAALRETLVTLVSSLNANLFAYPSLANKNRGAWLKKGSTLITIKPFYMAI